MTGGGTRKSPAASLDILVVEDCVDTAELLDEAFSSQGQRVRIAKDAASGLEVLRSTRPPRALIVDLGVLGDAFHLAEAARRDLGAALKIAVFSGVGRPEDHDRAKRLNATFLVKPVELEDIKRLLEAWSRA